MIIYTFNDNLFDDLKIDIKKINYLYDNYGDIHKKIFKLEKKNFELIKNAKTSRSGFLIRVLKKKKLVAYFTFSKSYNCYYELGDIAKVSFKFNRNIFSECLKISSEYVIKKKIAKGIFGFPNQLALPFELLAGYKITSFYIKSYFLVFFNILFFLPFFFYKSKIFFNLKFYKKPFIRFNQNIEQTSLILLKKIKIFKRSPNLQKKKFHIFGLLCEYDFNKKNGYPFIYFGPKEFMIESVKFEYSETSI